MTTTLSSRRSPYAVHTGRSHPSLERRWWLFAVAWSVAALFHLAGNARPVFGAEFTPLGLVQLGVGAAAVWTLVRPRRVVPLTTLCAAVLVSTWFEAPVVGNHWVLAAVLSLTFILSVALARRRRNADGRGAIWRTFAPTARLGLLLAYGFAAFAKLNSGFFDPEASCAVFYGDQLLRSWGLGVPDWLGTGRVLAPTAAAIELSVPLLLLAPLRWRRAGLLVAFGFHWLLALGLLQHFWDFSAVLFAGFLLFLDDAQVEAVTTSLRRIGEAIRPAARRLLAGTGLTAAVIVTLTATAPNSPVLRAVPILIGHLAWLLLGTTVLAVVVAATLRTAPTRGARRLRPAHGLLVVVPLLVVANGLTPYLELKTGYGWNMYSNLRTVEGESNHFMIPATLDLTGAQRDRVTVLASSDDDLATLEANGYSMVWSEFREWAAVNPEASVTYRRGAVVTEIVRVADDPALGAPVNPLLVRLQPFRLVDESGTERCLTHYTAGR